MTTASPNLTSVAAEQVFARITVDVLVEEGFTGDDVPLLQLEALQLRHDADVVDIDVLQLRVQRAFLTMEEPS